MTTTRKERLLSRFKGYERHKIDTFMALVGEEFTLDVIEAMGRTEKAAGSTGVTYKEIDEINEAVLNNLETGMPAVVGNDTFNAMLAVAQKEYVNPATLHSLELQGLVNGQGELTKEAQEMMVSTVDDCLARAVKWKKRAELNAAHTTLKGHKLTTTTKAKAYKNIFNDIIDSDQGEGDQYSQMASRFLKPQSFTAQESFMTEGAALYRRQYNAPPPRYQPDEYSQIVARLFRPAE